MNLDIQNIGHYRVTSHGGGAFVLFNREDDLVYSVLAKDYKYITEQPTVDRCRDVEYLQLHKEVSFDVR